MASKKDTIVTKEVNKIATKEIEPEVAKTAIKSDQVDIKGIEETTEAQETANKIAEETKAESWMAKRVLKVGKPIIKGDDVKALQTALIANGYNCGVAGANGIFGKETAHAVRMFQSMNRLIVDGRAGRFTITKLGGTWEEPKKK